MYERWSHIFEGEAASYVDPVSIHLVEGLMPQSSMKDRNRIAELVESGQIFALVAGAGEREVMRDRLLSTPGRIISLNTLTQDTLFLEEPAKALRCLCPPKFRGSFRETMLRQWNMVGTERSLEIQRSEHDFATMQQTANSFSVCTMQLWLFALRHFTHQQHRVKNDRRYFGWSTEESSLTKLAILAERLGFQSDQITALRSQNLNQNIAKGFIESLCKEEFYKIEDRRVQSMSNRLYTFLRNLPKYSDENIDPAKFTTNSREEEAKHRFNSPTREQYDQLRKHLFLEKIFEQDQPAAQYPTSLGVTREILYCFFGNAIQDMISSRPAGGTENYAEPLIAPCQPSNNSEDSLVLSTPTSHVSDHQQGSPMEAAEPSSHSVITYQMQTEEIPPDQASSQYSRSPGTPVTKGDSPSEAVDIDPYPSGTPDPPPPLAAGFEDPSCICPMEKKITYLCVEVLPIFSGYGISHNER